jgi:hypothetical protein
MVDDPHLDVAKIIINKVAYTDNIINSIDSWIEKNLKDHNELTIVTKSTRDVCYELGCVIYVIDPNYPEDYFLYQQLKTWESSGWVRR